MNTVNCIFRYARNDDDSATRTVRIRANKSEIKVLLRRKTQRPILKAMMENGPLQEPGCDCTHCRNDWDCCGNMTLSYNQVRRVKRGVVIIQHLSRNV